jgi:hypothetical protein
MANVVDADFEVIDEDKKKRLKIFNFPVLTETPFLCCRLVDS